MDSKSFEINFYDVMGLNKSCTPIEIKKAYNSLSKKYHPDKTDDPIEIALFELIQRAYECLGNEAKRKEYDFYINNVEKSKFNDHESLKNSFNELLKTQENTVIDDETKTKAKLEFSKAFDELDKKHKINRASDVKITDDDIDQRIEDLKLQREQDSIEFTHSNLFEGSDFDLSKFNAVFDNYKKHENKIIKRNNIAAFNDTYSTDFAPTNVDNIYDEDEENNMFKDSRPIDLENIKRINPAEYTTKHNDKTNFNFDDELQRRKREREQIDEQIRNRTYNDWDVEDNSYKFLHNVVYNDSQIQYEEKDLMNAVAKLKLAQPTKSKKE